MGSGNVFSAYPELYDQEVRLTILKGLADEDNGRLSDAMLMLVFEAFAINKSREYLRNQLRWLEREAGAVRLRQAGTAVIAELTDAGMAHVRRKTLIEGIKPPSFDQG